MILRYAAMLIATCVIAASPAKSQQDRAVAKQQPGQTAPTVLHDFARGAQRDLTAVTERMAMLRLGDEVISGIMALDTAGHTPGHLSFEVAGNEGLIITADAATSHVISFEHPSWRFGYDMMSDMAIRNRHALLDRAAAERLKLLGYHWAYPGVGFAERKGPAFRFVPAAT